MKTTRLMLALFALIAFTAFANAQAGIATITENGAVQIDTEQPLQTAYAIDASNFDFQSEQEAIEFLADKQSKFVSYRPVFHNNVIMVYLQTKAKPEWTKSEWNAYLSQNKIKGKVATPAKQTSK